MFCRRYAPPIAPWTERSTARGLDWISSVHLVDRVELGQPVDSARIGDRNEPLEVPVVLDRQGDPLLVRERPHHRWMDRPAEVGVELGQATGAQLGTDGRSGHGAIVEGEEGAAASCGRRRPAAAVRK